MLYWFFWFTCHLVICCFVSMSLYNFIVKYERAEVLCMHDWLLTFVPLICVWLCAYTMFCLLFWLCNIISRDSLYVDLKLYCVVLRYGTQLLLFFWIWDLLVSSIQSILEKLPWTTKKNSLVFNWIIMCYVHLIYDIT